MHLQFYHDFKLTAANKKKTKNWKPVTSLHRSIHEKLRQCSTVGSSSSMHTGMLGNVCDKLETYAP